VPNNIQALAAFRRGIKWLWGRSLPHGSSPWAEGPRRSQKDRFTRSALTGSSLAGFPRPASLILGRKNASPSPTRGGSRMPELGTSGSVRGVCSDAHPYRDKHAGPHSAGSRAAGPNDRGLREEHQRKSGRQRARAIMADCPPNARLAGARPGFSALHAVVERRARSLSANLRHGSRERSHRYAA